MNFIKNFKMFESTDPNSFLYGFEFPVRKAFNIQDKDAERIIYFIEEERGIDIIEIIRTEVDLGSYDFDNLSWDVSREEVESNLKYYFDLWIKQKYKEDYSKFYRTFDLDFYDDFLSKEDFATLKTSFNSRKMEADYPYKELNQNFKIELLRVIGMRTFNPKEGTVVIGRLRTNRKLNRSEIDSLKDYLEYQLSDDWGKDLKNEAEEEGISNCRFLTYIETYWRSGWPSWFLDIKEK